MFVMWLGERITDRGIGNGISLIIMVGIIARLPYALTAEAGEKFTGNGVGGQTRKLTSIVLNVNLLRTTTSSPPLLASARLSEDRAARLRLHCHSPMKAVMK